MDRQAFKLRMQNLKSYRENNPGKGYWDWKKAIQNYKGIDIDNDPTYDYYGFYKENPLTAKDILNDSEDAHFTDTYKTSVHPTFSNESKYSGYVNEYNPKGITGGYWGEDNSYNFSDSQIKNNWDVHDTLRYLEDAENYGVTAKYKNMYPKDIDNTIYGGVLPQVEIKAQTFANGGESNEEANNRMFVGPITEELMLDQNKLIAKERMRNLFLRNEGGRAKANPDFANYMYDFDFDRLNHEDPNERKYTLLNYWKRSREVRDKEIGKYTTPYIPEKEIMLTTGRFNTGRISTNVLDSLLASSKRTGYPFEDALGLAARESGLGYARYHRAKGKLSNTALLSNWNLVLTIYNTNNMVDKFKSIYNKYMNELPITDKELDFIKLYIDNEDKQYDSTRPITENVWDNALKQFESGNYNPADPTYMDKVREEGRMLMQDRAIKKWAKTAKFNEGGEVDDNYNVEQSETDSVTDILTGMLPLYGTYLDYKKFRDDPSLENFGWMAASAVGDILFFTGAGAGIKALKAAKAANQIRRTLKADRYTKLLTAKNRYLDTRNLKMLGQLNRSIKPELQSLEQASRNYDMARSKADIAYRYLLELYLNNSKKAAYDIARDTGINTAQELSETYRRYEDGGETGNELKEKFYQITGRSSSGRPLEQGLKPVIDLEGFLNFTPVGDVIAANDTYQAAKNDDWLGAGLAAATMIPFVPTTVRNFRKKYKGITPKREIPTVNKAAQLDAINEALKYKESRIKLHLEALNDRNLEYENWIENEDAFRRAANFDRKYGTDYVGAYTRELKNYANSSNSDDLIQVGIKPMFADGSFDPAIPDYIFIGDNLIKYAKPRTGLVNHEMGHNIDRKAGVIGSLGELNIPIFDRSKFESAEKIKLMYPKTHKKIQDYLLNDSEIKSHMNDFRTYLRVNKLLNPSGKETLNSFKKKLFESDFDNLKKIFNSYKSGKQFILDFNSIPITGIDDDSKVLV